jgi:hypothetical protein
LRIVLSLSGVYPNRTVQKKLSLERNYVRSSGIREITACAILRKVGKKVQPNSQHALAITTTTTIAHERQKKSQTCCLRLHAHIGSFAGMAGAEIDHQNPKPFL